MIESQVVQVKSGVEITVDYERLIRFTAKMLPDTRTELEHQNLEGLMIAFNEAKRVYDEKKSAQRQAATKRRMHRK